MGILSITIVLRGTAWFALLTFVPLWIVADGGTKGEGGRVLALMLVAGAIGTLVLGPVADRIGLRRTLIVTQALIPFGIVAFVAIGGVPGTIALMVVGLCTVGTFGVTMVLSQVYLPRHVGMASGLTVGLAMGIGGIAAVALGAVADAIDLETALYAAAVAPALGCIACFFLPRPSSWSRSAKPASAGIV
jgi:FSR family fosmidomycin resistance protein-like MFS transporter